MPRPVNHQARSRLLSIGQGLIHSQGFNGCGVQGITAAAGIPKGSFYSYFPSKEAFVVEVLEEYWSSIESRHGPMLYDARIKPLERIAKYFQALAADHARSDFTLGCLIGNISLELSHGSQEIRAKLAALMERWRAPLADCLREAQARRELDAGRDADELASALIEAWEGAAMRGKVEQGHGAYDRFDSIVLPRLLS